MGWSRLDRGDKVRVSELAGVGLMRFVLDRRLCPATGRLCLNAVLPVNLIRSPFLITMS
jgi:hypothetical protein